MKLLFVTENEISPMQGGTERVTATLAGTLRKRGISCYLAFIRPCTLPMSAGFDGKLQIKADKSKAQLERFISQEGIDAVISNLVDIRYKRLLLPILRDITDSQGKGLVVCYHAMPGEELLGNTPGNSIWRILHGGSIKSNLKDLLLTVTPRPVTEMLFRSKIRKRYRLIYDNADRVVLLSERFYPEFVRLGGLRESSKLRCSGNALSYEEFLAPEELRAKKKTVMVLCRLDEKPKRISRVLKAWKYICHDDSLSGWTLKIVGGGPDEAYYRHLARRLSLSNLSFEGRREDVLPYYREASVFLMTSAFEGWGVTLTEAMQMGAVSVVMDSYASLRDIITDGTDACITPDKDIKAFAHKLKWLMEEDETRMRMAIAGLDSCRRFSKQRNADEMLTIINEACSRSV